MNVVKVQEVKLFLFIFTKKCKTEWFSRIFPFVLLLSYGKSEDGVMQLKLCLNQIVSPKNASISILKRKSNFANQQTPVDYLITEGHCMYNHDHNNWSI
jgi:hypothetical protein